jgi:ankyrin repeat protein
LEVVAALRLLLEDMDLGSRANVFDVVSIGDQLDKKNTKSDTALHIAAAARYSDSTVCRLLAWRADVTLLNNEQKSPLDLANGSCVGLLARMAPKRVDDSSQPSNQEDMLEYGWTSLMVAAEIGDTHQIDALLRQENNINATNSKKRSALHIAASAGNAEALKLLVERKADLECRDENQHTALCSAARKGSANCIRNLVEARADLTVVCKAEASSSKSETVLDLASGNECTELLKGYGVDGWTPLMVAVERGHYSAKMFLDTRENLLCMHNGRPFSSEFQRALRLYSGLAYIPETWKWGRHEASNLVLSEDGCKVSKVRDRPDYSCALGDAVFEAGVHRWTLKAKNVSSMWAGVARHVTEAQLGTYPGGIQTGDWCCIAFGSSSSDVRVFGDKAEITCFSQSGYSSDQKLDFELDMYAGSLKFSVDGVLAVVVSNLDRGELQPYVCMDYSESVELLVSASFTADESCSTPFDDVLVGTDNSDYSQEFDAELLKYSPDDSQMGMPLQHTLGGKLSFA